jgi:endoglucanase
MKLYEQPTEPYQPTEPLAAPMKRPRSRRKLLLALVGIMIFATLLGLAVSLGTKQGQRPNEALGAGPWHTDGSQLLDAANQPVRIAGINWFGFETSTFAPHGLQDRNYKDMLDQIKGLGYNTSRLPYSNQLFDPASRPVDIDYAKNPDLQGLQGVGLMDRIISYASSIGLHIILDQHRPDASGQSALWYTSAYPESRWIADWQKLALRYRDNPMVIWRLAAERAGNAILATNPNWLIFVEGVDCYGPGGVTSGSAASCGWWGGNLQGVRDYPLTLNIAHRLVYSVHDYPASVRDQPWLTAASYPANLPAVWDSYWGYIQKEGIAPVWVGEFGTSLATQADRQWFSSLVNYLGTGARGFNWTFWCWNPDSVDTGGLLKSDWLAVNAEKQDQLKTILFPLGRQGNAPATEQKASPGATATSTAATQPGALSLDYQNGNQSPVSNQIQPALKLTNTGSGPISLAVVTIRYWYTADSAQTQGFACDYATIGCNNVRYRFVKLEPARPSADTYLEISFMGGQLQAGASTEIKLRVHKSDWSNYNQANDYSFTPGVSTYSPAQHIGIYYKAKLTGGREP